MRLKCMNMLFLINALFLPCKLSKNMQASRRDEQVVEAELSDQEEVLESVCFLV